MTKLYQVVDDNDQIVGHKLRDAIDWQKDIYRIAALWLTNSKGQVLIAQRVLTKDKDPGKWGPAAAGTLEKGEDYESNIYKEAEEEIGLTNCHFIFGPRQRFYKPRQAFCQWFLGVCDKKVDEFKLQTDEVEKIVWVDIKQLRDDVKQNPDKYVPSMKDILEVL